MIAVLQKKLDNLMRGDEGVALVVTLALFMFLYVSAAGVFAIGRAAKDKIALQNAVDAAAYSAAIVEADTLSKIATINRAMAWTYKSMVCRQMDYISKRLLNESVNNAYAGSPSYLTCEDAAEFIAAIKGAVSGTIELPSGQPSVHGSVISQLSDIDSLFVQIVKHKLDLILMSATINALANDMPAKIQYAVEDMLENNLPGRLGARCLFRLSSPNVADIFRELSDEDWFLRFADLDASEFNETWFPKSSSAIRRDYPDKKLLLMSHWYWREKVFHTEHWESRDAHNYYDACYAGVDIAPLVLSKDYFEAADGTAKGAITVAVAMQNENPWEKFVERSGSSAGIYDVFDPPVVDAANNASWTWAVSSAQAAYRGLHAQYDPDKETDVGSDYSLAYEKTENLRTHDWDAVFVPVCKAMNETGFQTFMTTGWSVDDDHRVQSESPESLSTYDVSLAQSLPRMHNAQGSLNKLDWGQVLRKMFH